MSRAVGRGYAFCQGTRKDGKPCGNKVPTLRSGAYIRRYCHLHGKRPTQTAGGAR